MPEPHNQTPVELTIYEDGGNLVILMGQDGDRLVIPPEMAQQFGIMLIRKASAIVAKRS